MTLFGTAEDLDAVESMLRRLREARRDNDPARAAAVYAEDADWMNAFGVRRRGRLEIQNWLTQLYTHPAFADATVKGFPSEIRFIRDDVAIVHRYQETTGQRTGGGEEMPPRRTHHVMILTRDAGAWKAVAHYIMDERDANRGSSSV